MNIQTRKNKFILTVLLIALALLCLTIPASAQNDLPAELVTGFDALAEEVQVQRVFGLPTLPEKLMATLANGQTAEVPVSWQTSSQYNAERPDAGLYVFTAELGGEYQLAEGVDMPFIAVMILSRARMAGLGTASSPLRIASAEHLAEIASLVNAGLLEKAVLGEGASGQVHLRLNTDIDLSAYGANWNGGKGWTPIGQSNTNPFRGHFDGSNFVITGLYINQEEFVAGASSGLFGAISGGTVTNLGLKDAVVIGNNNVGGIAGSVSNGATIKESYFNGTVVGLQYLGGLVGVANSNSNISNCYSGGSVATPESGIRQFIGGLVGSLNNSTVVGCYSTSDVIGDTSVGGLVGYSNDSNITNCAALNRYVEGKINYIGRLAGGAYGGTLSGNVSYLEMTTGEDSSFPEEAEKAHLNGMVISASSIITGNALPDVFKAEPWDIKENCLPTLLYVGGQSSSMPAYILLAESGNYQPEPLEGGGNEIEPYLIESEEDLLALAYLVNSGNTEANNINVYYKLTKDLDLSCYGENFNDGAGWVPIGGANPKLPFLAHFDGDGHVIENLYISRNAQGETANIGLFGKLLDGASIKNLGLVNVNVSSSSNAIGGLAGAIYDDCLIENCYVTGTVTGTARYRGWLSGGDTGGVIGSLVDSDIRNCYFSGDVTSINNFVGGIAGAQLGGTSTIENCYSTGSVSGNGTYTGGVVGSILVANVKNCYSTSKIHGNTYAGGITGCLRNGAFVENCYATGAVSAHTYAGGIAGRIDVTLPDRYSAALKNCLALNSSIDLNVYLDRTGEDTFIGRVVGACNFEGALSDNYAFSGIGDAYTIFPEGSGLTHINGEDISKVTIYSSTFPAAFNNTPWEVKQWYGENGLPTLVNLGGQDGSFPLHLAEEASVAGFEGNGSGASPYLIKSADDLKLLCTLVNQGNSFKNITFRLEKDIDISPEKTGWIADWWVIGQNEYRAFSGYFDGNGHTISGLTITSRGNSTVASGLFGYIDAGGVSNLHLEDVSVIDGGDNSGALVGYATGSFSIINCSAAGNIQGGDKTGGLVGFAAENGIILSSSFTGSVNGDDHVGGLVGAADGAAVSIRRCYTVANVQGGYVPSGETPSSTNIGGLAGYLDNGASLSNSYSTGSVQGLYAVGGLAGYLDNGASLSNCYSTSSIKGSIAVGGLVGILTNDGSVTNCAALNPYVDGSTNFINRVVGANSSGTMSGNVAFSGMLNKENGELLFTGAGDATEEYGASKTAAELTAFPSFWSEADKMNWPASGTWDSPWQEGNDDWYLGGAGMLPILNGITGQTSTHGLYLTGLPHGELAISPQDEEIVANKTAVQNVTFVVTGFESWTHQTIAFSLDKDSVSEGVTISSSANGIAAVAVPVGFSGIITVTATNTASGKSVSSKLFVVEDNKIFDFEVSADSLSWTAAYGYNMLLNKTVTITNTGNTPLANIKAEFKDASAPFTLSISACDELAVQGTFSFDVTYKDALDVGLYQATLVISAENARSVELPLSFEVGILVPQIKPTSTEPVFVVWKGDQLPEIEGYKAENVLNKPVDGTFVWKTDETQANRSGLYTIEFQPESANYATVTKDVFVYATDKSALLELIEGAEKTLAAASIGAGDGQHSQQACNNLAQAISTAQAFANGPAPMLHNPLAEAMAALQSAVTAFDEAKISVDFTALDAAISKAKAAVLSDYTAEAWQNLQQALADAEAVRGTANVTQAAANAAAQALQSAANDIIVVEPPAPPTNGDVESTEKDGTATANVTEQTITALIKKAQRAGDDEITLNIINAEQAESVTVTIARGSLQELARAGLSLNVVTGAVTTRLDAEALAGMAEDISSGQQLKVVVKSLDKKKELTPQQNAAAGKNPVLELAIFIGNKQISSFEGSISVAVDVDDLDLDVARVDYDLLTVYYLDVNGNLREVQTSYDTRNGSISFAATDFSAFVIMEWRNPFSDISKTDWFYRAIRFAYNSGLMLGTESSLFEANRPMSRAMLVTVLYRLEGEPKVSGNNPFSDVAEGQWYTNAILWAWQNGIVSGYGDNQFGPNDNITREQLAAILMRYAEWKGLPVSKTTDISAYADAKEVSPWALAALQWANAEGLILGRTATTLAPQGTATRAEIAQILMRFIQDYLN